MNRGDNFKLGFKGISWIEGILIVMSAFSLKIFLDRLGEISLRKRLRGVVDREIIFAYRWT